MILMENNQITDGDELRNVDNNVLLIFVDIIELLNYKNTREIMMEICC